MPKALDLGEARDYLAPPLLGARLREITSILHQLGRGDDDPHGHFPAALDRWFDSEEDAATLERLIA